MAFEVRSREYSLPLFSLLVLACSGGDPTGGATSATTGDLGSGGSVASGGASSGGNGSGGDLGLPAGGAASGGNASGGADGAGGSGTVAGVPTTLSETGLFQEDGVTLGEGVRPFAPRFQLWTDTAAKRRFIYLPPGTQIDTSDMDAWKFPPGTKLWKEFSRDNVRVETRLLYKAESGSWKMMAYLWRSDLSDADAVPEGVENASTTAHDVPSTTLCADCHAKVADRVLGFSAVQLSKPDTGGADMLGLDDLEIEGLLTHNPGTFDLPGSPTEQAALGYLHANCGHCHNPDSSVAGQVPMFLWLNVGELGSVETTQTYLTTVNKELSKGTGPVGTTHRIAPGDLVASGVFARMASRGPDYSMPPLGTEDPDDEGLKAVEDWIMSLAH